MIYPKKMTATIAVGDSTSNSLELLDFQRAMIELPASTKTFGLKVANASTDTFRQVYNYHDATHTAWGVVPGGAISVEIPESALSCRYIQVMTDTTATAAALTAYLHVAK